MKGEKDYFGYSYLVSVLLATFPVTSWVCGIITRYREGKMLAVLVRVFLGSTLFWLLDCFGICFARKICRFI